MFKKLVLTVVILFFTGAHSVYGGEFQYGTGTMKLKGGFFGLTGEISADVATYSLVQQHKTVLDNSLFYAFEVTWYDSDNMEQGLNQLQTLTSGLVNLSALNYRLQGLDANFVFGVPLFITDSSKQYFSIGLNLGLSIPWIENNGGNTQQFSLPSSPINPFGGSKTEIQTYKVGPVIRGAIELNDVVSLNGDFSYNYQTGSIKNDEVLDSNLSVNGSVTYLSIGLKIEPIKTKTKIWFMTVNPSLFFTVGYDYAHWIIKDVNIDISGVGYVFSPSDLEITSSIFRLGAGYAF